MDAVTRPIAVDPDWIRQLVAQIRDKPDHRLALVFDAVRPPSNPLEQLVLRGLIAEARLASAFGETIGLLWNIEADADVDREDSLSTRAMKWIDANFASPSIHCRDVARAIGVGSTKLQQRFSRAVGVTVMRYVHEARLREARRLLLNRDLSVKEIAAMVGYGSTVQLDRHFRASCRITPSQWRRSQ